MANEIYTLYKRIAKSTNETRYKESKASTGLFTNYISQRVKKCRLRKFLVTFFEKLPYNTTRLVVLYYGKKSHYKSLLFFKPIGIFC